MRCRIAEDEDAGLRAGQAARDARRPHPRPRGAHASWSPGSRTCSGWPSTRPATSRTSSPPGASSSSAWPTTIRRCSPSRTCSGPTPACSTSSSTCSTGRAAHPIFVITLARPELLERRPTWGAGQRSFTSLYLEPLSRRGDAGAPDRPRTRASRRRSASRSSPAPRASRCTRSRPCACCSTAACSSGGRRVPADRSDGVARGAGDAARADRRPARRPLHGGAAAAPERRRARQDLHARRARHALTAPEADSSRCSRRSCARRCSAFRQIRAPPSTASTASSRISCATSPTRRSRSAIAGRSTWPRPST